jgi:hypothetical protein
MQQPPLDVQEQSGPAADFTARAERLAPAKREHLLNVAIITGAMLAMFWRVIFLGETLLDVRTLDNQLPWGYAAGETEYPYNRRDLTDMYATRDYFVAAAYKDGELPLWNPLTMAGHPIYADGVTRILSPSLLVYAVLDVPNGYSIARIIELFLGTSFFYVLLNGISISPKSALFGSLVFAFSAHSMLHLTGLGWWGGLMWLPLILLFVIRATEGGWRNAVIAGLLLALQFFCGYMANQIYYIAAILLCYGMHTRRDVKAVRRTSIRAAATLAVGFGVAASQWVPVMELLRYSNRLIVPTEIGYIYLPPWYIATLVFPNLFGSAYDPKVATLFAALNVSHDHILYLGIAALPAIALAFLYGIRRRDDGGRSLSFFAWLVVLSLAVMIAAPLYVHLTRFIPVLQTIRVVVRAGVLLMFALSALAGFGFDMLAREDTQGLARVSRNWRRLLIAAGALAASGVIASYAAVLSSFANDQAGKGAVAFLRKSAAALGRQFMPPDAGIILPLLFGVAVALLLAWAAGGRISRQRLANSLIALLVVDLFWIASQFNPAFDSSRVFPPTEITETLRRLPRGRVLITPSDLLTNRTEAAGRAKIVAPPNTMLAYGIPVVTGKDQLYPRWYREYATLVEPQPNLSHVVFDQPRSPFLDALNAKYVLTRAGAAAPEFGRLLLEAEGVSLYENDCAAPRAFMVAEDAGTALDTRPSAALDRLADGFQEVTLERGVPSKRNELRARAQPQHAGGLCYSPAANRLGAGRAEITEDRRNRVTVTISSETGGVLVLSDNYYPGWTALLDGQPVELLRANHTMRAVRVPAGDRVVSFVFAPQSFWISLYAGAGICLLAFAAIAIGRRRLVIREGEAGCPQHD